MSIAKKSPTKVCFQKQYKPDNKANSILGGYLEQLDLPSPQVVIGSTVVQTDHTWEVILVRSVAGVIEN